MKEDNKQLRDQICSLTKTYEKEIKKSEKMQYEIKNLKNLLKSLELKTKEQKTNISEYENLSSCQAQEIEEQKKQIQILEKELIVYQNQGTTNSMSSPRNSKAENIAHQLFNEIKTSEEPGILENRTSRHDLKKYKMNILEILCQLINLKGEPRKNSMQIFLQAHGNLLTDLKDCKEEKENKDGELFNDTVVTEERKGSLNASSPKGKIKLDPSAFKVTGLIPPKPLPIRRDPYEEFFMLTSQCVKLNSPFMDDILALDTSGYYKSVLEQYIPFHKWYDWVQDKLLAIRKQLLQDQSQQMMQHQLLQY